MLIDKNDGLYWTYNDELYVYAGNINEYSNNDDKIGDRNIYKYDKVKKRYVIFFRHPTMSNGEPILTLNDIATISGSSDAIVYQDKVFCFIDDDVSSLMCYYFDMIEKRWQFVFTTNTLPDFVKTAVSKLAPKIFNNNNGVHLNGSKVVFNGSRHEIDLSKIPFEALKNAILPKRSFYYKEHQSFSGSNRSMPFSKILSTEEGDVIIVPNNATTLAVFRISTYMYDGTEKINFSKLTSALPSFSGSTSTSKSKYKTGEVMNNGSVFLIPYDMYAPFIHLTVGNLQQTAFGNFNHSSGSVHPKFIDSYKKDQYIGCLPLNSSYPIYILNTANNEITATTAIVQMANIFKYYHGQDFIYAVSNLDTEPILKISKSTNPTVQTVPNSLVQKSPYIIAKECMILLDEVNEMVFIAKNFNGFIRFNLLTGESVNITVPIETVDTSRLGTAQCISNRIVYLPTNSGVIGVVLKLADNSITTFTTPTSSTNGFNRSSCYEDTMIGFFYDFITNTYPIVIEFFDDEILIRNLNTYSHDKTIGCVINKLKGRVCAIEIQDVNEGVRITELEQKKNFRPSFEYTSFITQNSVHPMHKFDGDVVSFCKGENDNVFYFVSSIGGKLYKYEAAEDRITLISSDPFLINSLDEHLTMFYIVGKQEPYVVDAHIYYRNGNIYSFLQSVYYDMQSYQAKNLIRNKIIKINVSTGVSTFLSHLPTFAPIKGGFNVDVIGDDVIIAGGYDTSISYGFDNVMTFKFDFVNDKLQVASTSNYSYQVDDKPTYQRYPTLQGKATRFLHDGCMHYLSREDSNIYKYEIAGGRFQSRREIDLTFPTGDSMEYVTLTVHKPGVGFYYFTNKRILKFREVDFTLSDDTQITLEVIPHLNTNGTTYVGGIETLLLSDGRVFMYNEFNTFGFFDFATERITSYSLGGSIYVVQQHGAIEYQGFIFLAPTYWECGFRKINMATGAVELWGAAPNELSECPYSGIIIGPNNTMYALPEASHHLKKLDFNNKANSEDFIIPGLTNESCGYVNYQTGASYGNELYLFPYSSSLGIIAFNTVTKVFRTIPVEATGPNIQKVIIHNNKLIGVPTRRSGGSSIIILDPVTEVVSYIRLDDVTATEPLVVGNKLYLMGSGNSSHSKGRVHEINLDDLTNRSSSTSIFDVALKRTSTLQIYQNNLFFVDIGSKKVTFINRSGNFKIVGTLNNKTFEQATTIVRGNKVLFIGGKIFKSTGDLSNQEFKVSARTDQKVYRVNNKIYEYDLVTKEERSFEFDLDFALKTVSYGFDMNDHILLFATNRMIDYKEVLARYSEHLYSCYTSSQIKLSKHKLRLNSVASGPQVLPPNIKNSSITTKGKFTYFTGGTINRKTVSKDIWRFDNESGTWDKFAELPYGIVNCSVCADNNNLYVTGGSKYPIPLQRNDILGGVFTRYMGSTLSPSGKFVYREIPIVACSRTVLISTKKIKEFREFKETEIFISNGTIGCNSTTNGLLNTQKMSTSEFLTPEFKSYLLELLADGYYIPASTQFEQYFFKNYNDMEAYSRFDSSKTTLGNWLTSTELSASNAYMNRSGESQTSWGKLSGYGRSLRIPVIKELVNEGYYGADDGLITELPYGDENLCCGSLKNFKINISTGDISELPELKQTRFNHSSYLLNNKLYLTGGSREIGQQVHKKNVMIDLTQNPVTIKEPIVPTTYGSTEFYYKEDFYILGGVELQHETDISNSENFGSTRFRWNKTLYKLNSETKEYEIVHRVIDKELQRCLMPYAFEHEKYIVLINHSYIGEKNNLYDNNFLDRFSDIPQPIAPEVLLYDIELNKVVAICGFPQMYMNIIQNNMTGFEGVFKQDDIFYIVKGGAFNSVVKFKLNINTTVEDDEDFVEITFDMLEDIDYIKQAHESPGSDRYGYDPSVDYFTKMDLCNIRDRSFLKDNKITIINPLRIDVDGIKDPGIVNLNPDLEGLYDPTLNFLYPTIIIDLENKIIHYVPDYSSFDVHKLLFFKVSTAKDKIRLLKCIPSTLELYEHVQKIDYDKKFEEDESEYGGGDYGGGDYVGYDQR